MFRLKTTSTPPEPFVIIGQERSGTTLLQTLMSSHPDMHCRGELFDTFQIDDQGQKITDDAAIFRRENDLRGFLDEKLSGADLRGKTPKRLGFKLLTHHNPGLILDVLAERPHWRVIHVRRANKLAQFASRQQVDKSGQWTTREEGYQAPRVAIDPKWAVGQCNALRLEDELLARYLSTLPNPLLTVDYTDLSKATTHGTILSFMGVNSDVVLRSDLKKQGQSTVLERFSNADEVKAHFTGLGLAHWLEGG
ncbi:MAG: sulfotransferase [Pseudomonadota bacterium]